MALKKGTEWFQMVAILAVLSTCGGDPQRAFVINRPSISLGSQFPSNWDPSPRSNPYYQPYVNYIEEEAQNNPRSADAVPDSEEEVEKDDEKYEDPFGEDPEAAKFGLDDMLTANRLIPEFKAGTLVRRREIPGHVIIVNGTRYHCGGTLITSRYVLTAACCLTDYHQTLSAAKMRRLRVLFSTVTLRPLDSVTRVRAISRIWTHPNFFENGVYRTEHDIGIALLNSRIRNVRRIFLVNAPITLIGRSAVVYGFAPLGFNSTYSNKLLKATMTIISNQTCASLIGYDRVDFMCATASSSGCYGDDGSPLMVGLRQVGIVSDGAYCDDTGVVPVTPIRLNAQWIRNITRL